MFFFGMQKQLLVLYYFLLFIYLLLNTIWNVETPFPLLTVINCGLEIYETWAFKLFVQRRISIMSRVAAESAASFPQLENCSSYFCNQLRFDSLVSPGSVEKLPDFSWTHNSENICSIKIQKYCIIVTAYPWKKNLSSHCEKQQNLRQRLQNDSRTELKRKEGFSPFQMVLRISLCDYLCGFVIDIDS